MVGSYAITYFYPGGKTPYNFANCYHFTAKTHVETVVLIEKKYVEIKGF